MVGGGGGGGGGGWGGGGGGWGVGGGVGGVGGVGGAYRWTKHNFCKGSWSIYKLSYALINSLWPSDTIW